MKGIVYIIQNAYMQGIVKIGHTSKKVNERMNDLYTTGIPVPFEVVYAVEFQNIEDAEKVEKQLHAQFIKEREKVNKNREWFEIEPDVAKEALRLYESKATNVTDEYVIENKDDKEAFTNSRERNKPIQYFEILNISKGEILTFEKDHTITCEVEDVDKTKVLFRNEKLTLSQSAGLVLKEMKYTWWKHVRGADHWCYRGTKLSQLI